MKKKMILTAVALALAFSMASAQGPSALYPFSMEYDSTRILMLVFPNPPGFSRFPDSSMTPFQVWLTNLPLCPATRPSARWDAQMIMRADSMSAVVDLGVASPHQKDADIPLQLAMEFLRVVDKLGDYPIIVSDKDTITYNKWLNGRYGFDPRENLIYTPGEKREASLKEYYQYLMTAISLNEHRTLIKNLLPVEENNIVPGTVYVQFKKDDSDSSGHAAVILDVCRSRRGETVLLAGWGGDPAQSFVVHRPWPPSDMRWFTLAQFKERLQKYGDGKFYRFPL